MSNHERAVPRVQMPLPTIPTSLGSRGQASVVLSVLVAMLYRRPDAFFWPQMIADDVLLFRDAWVDGIGSVLMPYEGYLLVPARLMAWVGSVGPVSSVPTFYALVALATILFTTARLASSRSRLPYVWLGALMLPLIPHDGELYNLALCYAHWILVLAAFVLLSYEAPNRMRQWIGDIALLAIVGLSGPLILAVVPFFIIRAIRERTAYPVVLSVIATICSVAQVTAILITGTIGRQQTDPNFFVEAIVAVGTKMLAVTFLGGTIPYELPPPATAVLGALLGGAVVIATAPLIASRSRALAAAIIFGIVFFCASAIVRWKGDPLNLVPLHHGDRYFYLPRLLLAWTLLLALAERRRRLAAILIALTLLAGATTFRAERTPYYDWQQWAPAIERGEETTVTVAPLDWKVIIPPRAR